MLAKTLMIQGTSSSVGKSWLVTALCRRFAQRGIRVAPFKAQNMSNNAAVCADGAEIGRSQAVQATAAGVEPTALMNPILLKPEGNARAQVIVMGRPWHTLAAGEYYTHTQELWGVVTQALDHLRAAYELVIIEGAGSPAELNLQAGDVVNMAVAQYTRAPVLLAGDIDRGGIFAQLLGTVWLLEPEHRALVRGLVVNKFRGDLALFTDGVRILEARSGLPVLGVVPFLPDVYLPEEDSATLDESTRSTAPHRAMIDIAVLRLPRLANFDDFTPLAAEASVRLRYVSSRMTLGQPHAIILPGTKSTMADLLWLRDQGLDQAIITLAAGGTAVVGICGGYQMLGKRIRDPHRVESPHPEIPGLGLLPVETIFACAKTTHQVAAQVLGGPGWLADLHGHTIQGYEIHMGRTVSQHSWLSITRQSHAPVALPDGAVDATGRIWGCYLHGLFANDALRLTWLRSLGWASPIQVTQPAGRLQSTLDTLANHVEAHLNIEQIEAIVWDKSYSY